MTRALVLAGLLVATTAHANIWEHALRGNVPDPMQTTYDTEMASGDEHAGLASMQGASYAEIKRQITLSVSAYRAASMAKPDAAEPWIRLATVVYSYYLDCDDPSTRSLVCNPRGLDRAHAEEVIEAWNEFEARAPLDPRLSTGLFGDTDILFSRAILHTKLATKEHLQAAAKDYEKILARLDGSSDGTFERVCGNLAETYMMVGRLDDAIEMYKEALRGGSDTSTWYGFAVALDRDERSQQAADVIRSLGENERDTFHANVMRGRTFFVPEGEKYYYFALIDEALGSEDDAIDGWRAFIKSGAHPIYQPRAKAHLEALLKRHRGKPAAASKGPTDPFRDDPL